MFKQEYINKIKPIKLFQLNKNLLTVIVLLHNFTASLLSDEMINVIFSWLRTGP